MSTPGNWDLESYFPEFDGDAYRAFRRSLAEDVASLRDEAGRLGAIDDDTFGAWVTLLERLEDVTARQGHLASYLGCLGAADARNEAVQSETASLATLRAELEKTFVRVRAALRDLEGERFQQLLVAPGLEDAGYFVERLRRRAGWSMEPAHEELAADLDTTGLSAWSRLYDQISGKLEFELERPDGETRRLPVSMTRTLLEDPDPGVRRAALLGSNEAWKRSADPVAACLNGIAGTRLLLYRRRGVEHFLDPALFDAGIARETLDSMFEAVAARQEVARRYLRRKAKLLGREKLGFQDLTAPLPGTPEAATKVDWDGARSRILAAFGRFYPALAEFAEMAFTKRWIDWEPRPGKRPGGFCTGSKVINETRIFTTFDGSLGDVSVVAHELGHAFHSWVMRDLRPWACRYPMTLAETASTFAEQLVIDAVLSDPDAPLAERATLLDSRLQDAAMFLLNIRMRFLFETRLYEERARGEIPVSRLCELMLEAQRECYGDALAEEELDPWFWASKLHFYISGLSFYNFPYTFGYLFSLGIFNRALEEGATFLPTYEALLRRTASDPAETVAADVLGVDLGKPDFWNASIDAIEAEGLRFEELAPQLAS